MKKRISVFITLFALLAILCSCGHIERNSFSIAPLCIHDSDAKLVVERDTDVRLLIDSAQSKDAIITETFSVTNVGNETTLVLVYPAAFTNCDLVKISIDGEQCTDWWAGGNISELYQCEYNGTLAKKLNDGTFFNRAFPNWPELGEQIHRVDPPEDAKLKTDSCGVSYYAKEVTIPANDTISVTVSFDEVEVSTMHILRLLDEIPCTQHTLTVTIDGGLAIEDQNVIDEMPDSSTWTVELDPAREDYYITVER